MDSFVARYAPALAMLALLIGCLLVPVFDSLCARLRRWQTRRCWQREARRADLRRRVMRSYSWARSPEK